MTADKNISLFTKAIQTDPSGDKSEIEFFVEARYTEKNKAIYITYKETELSGMEGTTTTLRITEDSLSILRFGTYNSKLEFIKGEQTHTQYQTPYGSVEITINTKLLDIELHHSEKSKIYLQYSLETAGDEPLNNEIFISFK